MPGQDENKIKQKIELDGEKDYKKALDDNYRALKVLKSELKAETAELGKNATAQDKNAVKVKSLQKQIQAQQKIVDTYKKALDEVKDKYKDNDEEIAKWERKLNNARATLANMKNDLDGVGDSMKGMANDASMATVASKSAADAIGSLADIGGSIADSIEGIFTGMLSTVKQTIADVWADVVDLAARKQRAGRPGRLLEYGRNDDPEVRDCGCGYFRQTGRPEQHRHKDQRRGLQENRGTYGSK